MLSFMDGFGGGMDFKVKNFEKLQRYKDRSPHWIKLYNSLLENYEFSTLSDAAKGHLILIFLLASRKENVLPWDEEWVTKRIHAQNRVNLQELLELGFIEQIQVVRTYVDDWTQVCLDSDTSVSDEERKEEKPPFFPPLSSDSYLPPIIPPKEEKREGETPSGKPNSASKGKTNPRLEVFLEEYRHSTGREYVVGNYAEEGGAASRTVAKIPDGLVYRQAVRAYLAAPDKRIVAASYPFLWFIRELNRWVGSVQGGEIASNFSGFEGKDYSKGVF